MYLFSIFGGGVCTPNMPGTREYLYLFENLVLPLVFLYLSALFNHSTMYKEQIRMLNPCLHESGLWGKICYCRRRHLKFLFNKIAKKQCRIGLFKWVESMVINWIL